MIIRDENDIRPGDIVEFQLIEGSAYPRWANNIDHGDGGDVIKGTVGSCFPDQITVCYHVKHYPNAFAWGIPGPESEDFDPDAWRRPGWWRRVTPRKEEL